MLENYPKNKIYFDQLDSFHFTLTKPFMLTVEWNGVMFDFFIKIKEKSSNLLILGSGAMHFEENRIGPPYFQRHSWVNDFDESVIYYNDPTLYLGDILLGWGQGTADRFYLKDIATILSIMIAKIQIPPKNVLFYGSSGGGFMSLILAGYIKDSTALVNSPQTCLTKWLPVPVNQLFHLSYPSLSQEQVMNIFPERINVIKFYNHINYVPNIYYLQNAACEIDVIGHLIPFIYGLNNLAPGCVVNKVKVDLYYDKQPGPDVFPALGGHGALGKFETIKYIKEVMLSK